MSTTMTLCTIQPAVVWGQPQRTFDHIAALLFQAAAETTLDLVVLPEHFNATFEEENTTVRWDAAYDFAAALARQHRVNLVAGSVERWDAGKGALLNTCVVFDRRGQEVGRYDKRRLFGYERRRGVVPGQASLVVELDGVRCGVLVCADLWHPELVRDLAGAIDVLCVPAQTTIRPETEPAYARFLWHSLALVRAQENVIAVATSDQAAHSDAPYRCGGIAAIVDPSAEPDIAAIQRTIPDGGAGYLCAQLDMERLARFRRYRQENGLLPAELPRRA